MNAMKLGHGRVSIVACRAPVAHGQHRPGMVRQHRFKAQCRGKLCTCQALVLVPSGDGTQDHLDEAVDAPKEIPLEDGQFEVGRGEDSTLRIAIPTVSTKHAILRIDGDTVSVTDLNSTNGTYINDRELQATKAESLKVGQTITFGDMYLAQYELEKRE